MLMVSMHHKSEHVVRAFQAGAIGYVTKESALENLVEGIRSALAGEFYLDPSMSQDVLKKLLEAEHNQSMVDAKYGTLSQREQEIMRLLAEGLSARAIAERLYISPKTVDNHRANIMRKLGLANTVDIVRCAARLGLLDLEEWRL
ncbi:DNA-binding response regulator, LuxR family [Desulfovibrio sp. DV]|nr:DNA-binding response regulator, LuxR family [Desulfovibrio sp. DV]